MVRKVRVWFPGAVYHITARGNRKASLYYDQEDYCKYLSILEDVRSKYPFILHSYCLMTNHLHLQMETTNHHIQTIMRELHARYAVYFNKKNDLDGHLFQGRYGSKLILSNDYFLEVSRYIHRNPLEAHMVTNPADYTWSSYPAYCTHRKNPHVSLTKTLSFFITPKHLHYAKFVEEMPYPE